MNLDNNESLKRLLLNMKYDSKKTLSENLNTLTLNNRQSFLILEGDQFTGTIVKSPGYQKTYEKLKLNKPFTLKNFSYQDSGNAQVVKIKGDHVETGMPVILKRTCGDANFELSFPENVATTNDMRLAIGSQISLPQLKTKTDNEKCNVRTNFDSSTHWVKDQETWEALKNGLQWMLNKGWLCPGGTPCGQKIATDSSDNWIVIDQVYFHKRKEYGAFAGAKCGVKAKLASGGQLSGAVKDEKDSWHIDLFNTFLIDENDGNVKLDIPKYVTKYVRCTEGSKKDEKVVDKTKSDVKTTQTPPKKTTVQSGWNETCQGTYSMGCKTPEVGRVQQCLKDQGLYPYTVDDKFGKRTRTAVYNKLGKSSFTDADIETICKTTSGGGGEPQDDFDLDMGRRTGEEQEIDDKTWTGDVY